MKAGFLAILFLVIALTISAVPSDAALVNVTSYPIWTNSGITVNASDIVTFSGASGSWNWGMGLVGPDGTNLNTIGHPEWLYDEWVQNYQHGQLIGFIGTVGDLNSNPRIISPGNSGLFAIGTGTVQITGLAGQVWLGFNDDRISLNTGDNGGSINVDVSSPVPEPGTMMLLGSGLVGLAGYGRKRFKK